MSERRVVAGYALAVLLVASALTNSDAMALGLLLQDIKAALHLSDTELGVLTGVAFAIFYPLVGIAVARWSDRGNRVTIIALAVALWSVMMVLSAVARSLPELLLTRIGAAASVAGLAPAAVSLIADCVDREEQTRAYAKYSLGTPLAVLIGFFAAGWLDQLYGWRVTFIVLGIPGVAVAALVWTCLQDPKSSGARAALPVGQVSADSDVARGGCAQPTLGEVLRNLGTSAALRHLVMCWVLMSFFNCGVGQFQPAFLIRSYGLTSGELGTWLAVINGLGGLVGTYWGGEWAARYAASNEPLQLKIAAVVWSGVAVSLTLFCISSDRYVAFGLLGFMAVIAAVTTGPLLATLQALVPSRGRATAFALIFSMTNIIGMGLGPLAAGLLSDALRPWFAEESLRYALFALSPGYLFCGWHLWQASKTVARGFATRERGGAGGVMRSYL